MNHNAEEDAVEAPVGKNSMCFVDLEKAFNRMPWKVFEWATRKRGIPEVLIESVKSLYEGAKTGVRVDYELWEEFEVKVRMCQGSVLSPFLLAVVVDVITELATEGVLNESLYADDLILMSETINKMQRLF